MLAHTIHCHLSIQQTPHKERFHPFLICQTHNLRNILVRPDNYDRAFFRINTIPLIRPSVTEIVVRVVNVRLVEIFDAPFTCLWTVYGGYEGLFCVSEAGMEDEEGLDDAVWMVSGGGEALNCLLEGS